MSTSILVLTIVHVAISLVAIASGFVVAFGMLKGKRCERWTQVFLVMTGLTSITGFMFPISGMTPALGTGIVAMLVLPIAVIGRYIKHLAGHWRWMYVISAMFSLYLNVFVLVVQLFLKVPPLHDVAPTQQEPPFAIVQLVVLLTFVVWTTLAIRHFRGASPHQQRTNLLVS
jgi:hypothetical protein